MTTERTLIGYSRAIVKFNGGNGALLCNRCRRIIVEDMRHRDVEHYCDECRKSDNGCNSSDQKRI